MALKLYYDLLSQPSRALYIFLKVTGIPFESKVIEISAGEHLSEEYALINPMKKIPAIVHNDFKLSESVAIFRYLCREFKVNEFWYPTESRAQAKVDEYLEWQHLNTRLHCASYFLVTVLMPMLKNRPPLPAKVKEHEARMSACLDTLENLWLKNKPFLTGDKISIADILGACEIEQTRMTGYDVRKGRPVLTAWLSRVADATNPYYDEANAVLNKFAAQLKKNQSGISSNL